MLFRRLVANMRARVIVFSLVAVALCLPACSSKNSRMDKRVDKLERDLRDLRNFQAEQTTSLAALRSELRRIRGRLEEVQFLNQNQVGGSLQDLKSEVSNLRRRVPPPALVPVIPLEEDELLVQRLRGERKRLLQNSLVRLREGSYREALPLLKELSNLSLAESYEANVLFWVGVAEEGAGNNPEALSTFNQLSSRFPEHPRAPMALLRQASVFVRLGDSDSAKLPLRKVISKYPKSEEASSARQKLKDLR